MRKKILQKIADFIFMMLESNFDNEQAFNYWMWVGLNFNYWCVEKDIYLN